MKVRIESRELYPYYTVHSDERVKKEIPADVVRIILTVDRRFKQAQCYLSALNEGNSKEAEMYLKEIREWDGR